MSSKLTVIAFSLAFGTALSAYYLARATPAEALRSSPTLQQGADGRMLYLKNCRTCHGATGEPSGENKTKYPKIKALNDAAFVATLSDDSMLVVLRKGKGKDMKSWTDKLTPPEMAAVVTYVRTLPAKKG